MAVACETDSREPLALKTSCRKTSRSDTRPGRPHRSPSSCQAVGGHGAAASRGPGKQLGQENCWCPKVRYLCEP